jgi:hypothetical protein
VPKGPDARATVAGVLYDFGREPFRIGAEAVLRVALQFAEEALKMEPAHPDALREKTRIPEERARRNRLRRPGEYRPATEQRDHCGRRCIPEATHAVQLGVVRERLVERHQHRLPRLVKPLRSHARARWR